MRRTELTLALALICALACAVSLARRLDAQQAALSKSTAQFADDDLYLSPAATRRLSLCFNGLVADWHWLRTLQYVGRKLLSAQTEINIDDLRALDMKNLAPLLDRATTLDPQFLAAYQYAAVVLPAVDADAAIRLLHKGIAANPQAWRLYQHLGYIYWQRGAYSEASRIYGEGAKIQGAPAWMRLMEAQMQTAGGSRATARAIYEQMYRGTDDEQVKKLAIKRLAQIQSLDERDALGQALNDFKARAGRCPAAWREMAPALRALKMKTDATGAPLDPLGAPYLLKTDECRVELGAGSEIPRK
jgi:tetratricopeptide (TPR) repeat protein